MLRIGFSFLAIADSERTGISRCVGANGYPARSPDPAPRAPADVRPAGRRENGSAIVDRLGTLTRNDGEGARRPSGPHTCAVFSLLPDFTHSRPTKVRLAVLAASRAAGSFSHLCLMRARWHALSSLLTSGGREHLCRHRNLHLYLLIVITRGLGMGLGFR